MCDSLIPHIKNTIDELGKQATKTTESNNLIDIELMHNRSVSINELLRLKQFLNEAMNVLNSKIDKAKDMQADDIRKIDQVMNNFNSASSWKSKLLTNLPAGKSTSRGNDTTDSMPATHSQQILPASSAPPIATHVNEKPSNKLEIKAPPGLAPPVSELSYMPLYSQPSQPHLQTHLQTHLQPYSQPYPQPYPQSYSYPHSQPLSPTVKIYFNSDIYLDAITVDNIRAVNDRGVLYYINTMDHFALLINGEVFHGNIGQIYNNQKDPIRVKACKYGRECNRVDTCTYYHDPAVFTGRKEIRNFAANSWTYIEPGASLRDPARIRRFGSRDNLTIDLAGITKEEVDRFNDQVFHDMLCMLVLRKHKK